MTVVKYLRILVNMTIFEILMIFSILHNIEIDSLFAQPSKITEAFGLEAAIASVL